MKDYCTKATPKRKEDLEYKKNMFTVQKKNKNNATDIYLEIIQR